MRPQAQADIDFEAVRAELAIPADYPAQAVAEAKQAAASPPHPEPDRRDIPLVTIDPPGSMDLDQAMCLRRNGSGYLVYYAIADVASFVTPGGALDLESNRRGQTLYSPDLSTPLHPRELSEGAASLLPDVDRAAVLWTIELDGAGNPGAVTLERALVRSTARLDYPGVAADFEAGRAHPSLALLPEIGKLRQQAAVKRHAITLNLPDVEVTRAQDDRWTLALRARNEIEDYNAEISLLTGMVAAGIMLEGKVGLLRTLPPAGHEQLAELRRSAAALGVPWPSGAAAGDVVATVDPATPKGAAFLEDAVRLLRGAGYNAFDGSLPEQTQHAGVGAPYAHVTAPLRRLADRYATEICLSLHQGTAVPDWVLTGLQTVPESMAASDKLAGELTKACTWTVVTFLLADRIGEPFAGTVVQIESARDRATVLLNDPPVRARCSSDGLSEGREIKVRLTGLDEASRSIQVMPLDSGE